LIRIAIAIGPRTWFGDKYRNKTVKNGFVRQNRLSGAFGYGIAISSAENFVVQSNVLFGNISFISSGPNCKTEGVVPASTPFVVDPHTIKNVTLQSNFVNISGCDSLTCVLLPNGDDFWPFGVSPSSPFDPGRKTIDTSDTSYSISSTTVPVAVIVSLLTAAISAIFIRRLVLSRSENAESFDAKETKSYTKQL